MKEVWQKTTDWWKKVLVPFIIILAVGVFCVLIAYLYHVSIEKGFLQAINENGTRTLIMLLAGVFGWYFLVSRTESAKRSAEAADQNVKIAGQNLTTEQLTRAIEQLANDKPFVRLGGILGLEQIAKSHEEESKKVARILVSFIRTHATKDSERTRKDISICNLSESEEMVDFSAYRAQRLDIEAAVNTLARISSELEKQGQVSEEYAEYGDAKYQICDLRNTDLRGLKFAKANLSNFDFSYTDMRGVMLFHTDLTAGYLISANFHGAEYLRGASFNSACLLGAIFTKAQIVEAGLIEAELEHVDFTGALLKGVTINGATLRGANLSDAQLLNMHGLQQHQLDEAFRLKGHKTLIRLAEGDSLEPPPEIEELPNIESN